MDKERILIKLAEMDSYVSELKAIAPKKFSEYEGEKKRACERLLQVSAEAVLDACSLLVSELKIGMPYSEEDAIKKLCNRNIISRKVYSKIRGMKACRNMLVHRYGIIDDRKIFYILKNNLNDFDEFKKDIIKFVRK